MSNANIASWTASDTRVNASADQSQANIASAIDHTAPLDASPDESKILRRHAATLGRPAWVQNWAFPIYSSLSEFV